MRLAVLTPTPARSVRTPGLVRAYRRKAHPNQPRAVFKPGSNRTPLPAEQRPDAEGAATAKKYRKIPVCVSFGFVGSGFHGLQSQPMRPDLPTVAATLRQALLKSGAIAESNFEPLSRTKWSLSSRTDKGVHAAGAAATGRLLAGRRRRRMRVAQPGWRARWCGRSRSTHAPRPSRANQACLDRLDWRAAPRLYEARRGGLPR